MTAAGLAAAREIAKDIKISHSVFALPFAGLATQIPMAALAGLLIVIGVQLVKITHIQTARRTGDLPVYLVTILGVVFLNLLNGVLLGLALSILLTVWRVAHTKVTAEATDENQWQVGHIREECTVNAMSPR